MHHGGSPADGSGTDVFTMEAAEKGLASHLISIPPHMRSHLLLFGEEEKGCWLGGSCLKSINKPLETKNGLSIYDTFPSTSANELKQIVYL